MRTRRLLAALILCGMALSGAAPVVGAADARDALPPARPPLSATALAWRLPGRLYPPRPLAYDPRLLRKFGIPLPAGGAPAEGGRVILISVSQQ
jgi:hypothetical protein